MDTNESWESEITEEIPLYVTDQLNLDEKEDGKINIFNRKKILVRRRVRKKLQETFQKEIGTTMSNSFGTTGLVLLDATTNHTEGPTNFEGIVDSSQIEHHTEANSFNSTLKSEKEEDLIEPKLSNESSLHPILDRDKPLSTSPKWQIEAVLQINQLLIDSKSVCDLLSKLNAFLNGKRDYRKYYLHYWFTGIIISSIRTKTEDELENLMFQICSPFEEITVINLELDKRLLLIYNGCKKWLHLIVNELNHTSYDEILRNLEPNYIDETRSHQSVTNQSASSSTHQKRRKLVSICAVGSTILINWEHSESNLIKKLKELSNIEKKYVIHGLLSEIRRDIKEALIVSKEFSWEKIQHDLMKYATTCSKYLKSIRKQHHLRESNCSPTLAEALSRLNNEIENLIHCFIRLQHFCWWTKGALQQTLREACCWVPKVYHFKLRASDDNIHTIRLITSCITGNYRQVKKLKPLKTSYVDFQKRLERIGTHLNFLMPVQRLEYIFNVDKSNTNETIDTTEDRTSQVAID